MNIYQDSRKLGGGKETIQISAKGNRRETVNILYCN